MGPEGRAKSQGAFPLKKQRKKVLGGRMMIRRRCCFTKAQQKVTKGATESGRGNAEIGSVEGGKMLLLVEDG